MLIINIFAILLYIVFSFSSVEVLPRLAVRQINMLRQANYYENLLQGYFFFFLLMRGINTSSIACLHTF